MCRKILRSILWTCLHYKELYLIEHVNYDIISKGHALLLYALPRHIFNVARIEKVAVNTVSVCCVSLFVVVVLENVRPVLCYDACTMIHHIVVMAKMESSDPNRPGVLRVKDV